MVAAPAQYQAGVVPAQYKPQPELVAQAPVQSQVVQAPYRPQTPATQWRMPPAETPSGVVQAAYKPQAPVVQAPPKPQPSSAKLTEVTTTKNGSGAAQQLVSPYGAGMQLPKLEDAHNPAVPTNTTPVNAPAHSPVQRVGMQPDSVPATTPAMNPNPSMMPPPASPVHQPGPMMSPPASPVHQPGPMMPPPAAPAAHPAGAVMTQDAQVQILHRIEQVGGPAVHDARIQSAGGNQCVIQLKVRSRQEGQEIGQKIMNLPELAPFKVDLQMQIEP
jgi:hypothetical protein